jgi:hypothetical protein
VPATRAGPSVGGEGLLSSGSCIYRSRRGIHVRCRRRGEFLQRIEAHLQLCDLEVQLLARAAELPAPQPRQLQLQVLDLQLMLAHQALQIAYIVGKFVSIAHPPIIRAMSLHAREVGKSPTAKSGDINTYYILCVSRSRSTRNAISGNH